MDAKREEAAALRNSGLLAPAIAQRLGVTKNTVYRWLNPVFAEKSRRSSLEAKRKRTGACVDCGSVTRLAKYGGVSSRCPSCASIAARTINHDKVVALRREGLTQQEIADRVGCAQGHVSYVLRNAGLGVGKGCGPGRGARIK